MMPYIPCKRGTLLIPSGPSDDPNRRHLFVICTDECEKGQFLIVPISTFINDLCDATCILDAHEHEFLKHKSYVLYRGALIEKRSTLEQGVVKGMIYQREDLNGQSFLRVRNGICKSKQTARKIKLYFGCP